MGVAYCGDPFLTPTLFDLADGNAYHIKEWQPSEKIGNIDKNASQEEEDDFEFHPHEVVRPEWDWYYSSSDSMLVVFKGVFGNGNVAMQSLNITRYSLTCAEEFLAGYERIREMSEQRGTAEIITE